jgi:hypothetical protein
LLGIAGLMVGSSHLLNLMNADMALDVTRLILAGILLYLGFRTNNYGAMRSVLTLIGVLYIGLAVIGLVSPTVGGLLPGGLTGFDIGAHLALGVIALVAAAAHHAPQASAHY